jgi:WD40 repeat protein
MKKPNWWPTRGPLETRVKLNETGREFLEASIRADRSRQWRLRLLVTGVIVVLAAAAVTAGVGFFKKTVAQQQAQASANQAIAERLVSEADDILARPQKKSGSDAQALQVLLAAHAIAGRSANGGMSDAVTQRLDPKAFQHLLATRALARVAADGGLLDAVVQRQTSAKIADIGRQVDFAALSPDGHRLAMPSQFGAETLQLWNTETGVAAGFAIKAHDVFAFSPDGHRLATGDQDGDLVVWNTDTQPAAPVLSLTKGQTGGLDAVAFSLDGRRITTLGDDNRVRTWDAATKAKLSETPVDGLTDRMANRVFSADLHRLAAADSDDYTVRVWDVETGQPTTAPMTGHTTMIQTLALSPDGHRLASAGDLHDNAGVLLWNADNGQRVAALVPQPEPAWSLAFSTTGDRLATGGIEGAVQLWHADTGQSLGDFVGHTSGVKNMVFTSDGHHLVTGSWDDTVRWWDLDVGQSLTGHTGGVTTVGFGPHGDRIATGSDGHDNSVRLWDTGTGRPIGEPLNGHTSMVTNVAFSPNGERLVSLDQANTVVTWTDDTGGRTAQLMPSLERESASISSDGHRIAIGSELYQVSVWDADSPSKPIVTWHTLPVAHPDLHFSRVHSVAFSPDGERVATSSEDDPVVRFWNPETGQPSGSPLNLGSNPRLMAFTMAFSRDGHQLAVSTGDEVQLWNLDAGKLVETLTGHTGVVDGVAFSPDGHHLATASFDTTVRLWDVDTGQPVGQPFAHGDIVNSVAFSPDGNRIASGSSDSTARLWPAAGTAEMLCDKITANMSRKQWSDWVSSDPQFPYIELCPGLPTARD